MKYIKSFNEELMPSTYRSAASRLGYYNKSTRSNSLYDFADERQYGFYKVHLANNSVLVDKNATFTDPKLIGVYYGSADNMTTNVLGYNVDIDKVANQAVKNWQNGSDSLSIVFEFGFRPTKETMSKKDFQHYKNPQRPSGVGGYLGGYVPLFSIQLELSEWYDGVEDWDSEAKWQAEQDGEEFEPSDIHKFYEWTRCAYLYIKSPNSGYFGIFADRKSAIKFREYLATIIDEKIKDRMMDLLTIVSGDAEDIDKAIYKFKNFKIHGLYDDEVDKTPSNNFKTKWYDKEL